MFIKNILSKKIALVCGSTQGIGKATAVKLAEMGATVILIARSEDKLREAIKDLPYSDDQQHSYLVADFSKPEALNQIIREFVSTYW
jgi:3-oxoacyl-[acyl-carrier protein] reductase